MTTKKRIFLQNGAQQSEPFHYRACGLDDVYLLNGFTKEESDYGVSIAIHDIDDLHRAIVRHLVRDKKRLSGKEFRFLRKYLNATQAELSILLGVDAQTIARYEKEETAIHGSADGLLKVLCRMCIMPSNQLKNIFEEVKMLMISDEPLEQSQVYFRSAPKGWSEDRC
jgi:putative transcriptional regulator